MRLSNIILAEGVKVRLSTLTYVQVAKALGDSRFSAPYASDQLRQINNEYDWESWKEETLKDYGDVEIELDPSAPWYGKIKVLDKAFTKDKADYTKSKGGYLDSERQAGKTSGLD